MVDRRRAWNDITALGQDTRSIDVRRGMTSSPLDYTHGLTTSGVTCHHRLWAAHSVERRLLWHVIIAVGQHTRSNYVGRGMISPPLECTHGRTTSGVARHHHLWTAHTIEQRLVWHAIIAFGKHTRSNDVARGMPSSPLGSTNGRMTSHLACHHRLEAAQTIEQRRAWHDITALGLHAQSDVA